MDNLLVEADFEEDLEGPRAVIHDKLIYFKKVSYQLRGADEKLGYEL